MPSCFPAIIMEIFLGLLLRANVVIYNCYDWGWEMIVKELWRILNLKIIYIPAFSLVLPGCSKEWLHQFFFDMVFCISQNYKSFYFLYQVKFVRLTVCPITHNCGGPEGSLSFQTNVPSSTFCQGEFAQVVFSLTS